MRSRTRCVFREWSIAVSLALSVFVSIGPSDLPAQTGTLHIQTAFISDAAWTHTLGLRYTTPRRAPPLPAPGRQPSTICVVIARSQKMTDRMRLLAVRPLSGLR